MFPTKAEMEAEIGGVGGFFILFGTHYTRMFADPRMSVLFDSRHQDTNVCALDHGKRIASFLADRNYGTQLFSKLGRGAGNFTMLGRAHLKAKKCPMRPQRHQNEKGTTMGVKSPPFTVDQRDTWLGHVMCSAELCGASVEF